MANQTHGFGTRISIGAVTFEEIDVTPVGLTRDDPVEQTSNSGTLYRRFAPAPLKTKSPATATVYYEKDDLAAIKAKLESDTAETITITFSDSSTLADTGWLQEFTPDAQVATERPQATITIEFEGETSAGTDEWTYTS
jgi:hypothetical protein